MYECMSGTLSTELDTEAAEDFSPFLSFLGCFEFFIHDMKKMDKTIFQNSATALLEICTFLPVVQDCVKSSSSSRSASLGEPSSRCRVGMLASLYSRRIPLCVSSVTTLSPSPFFAIHCRICEREKKARKKARERGNIRRELDRTANRHSATHHAPLSIQEASENSLRVPNSWESSS
jgi:hypothetical protein